MTTCTIINTVRWQLNEHNGTYWQFEIKYQVVQPILWFISVILFIYCFVTISYQVDENRLGIKEELTDMDIATQTHDSDDTQMLLLTRSEVRASEYCSE
jgi:hypothetical protein